MSPVTPPGPTPTSVSRPFWAAAAEGRLALQRCGACGAAVHYPRVLCPRCWSSDLAWQDASGRGAVWTFTVLHRAGHPAWQSRTPYVVAIVELEEGPRLLANVVDAVPSAVAVGMGVQAVFRDEGDVVLPQFRPADAR